jgi:hypothetical protein
MLVTFLIVLGLQLLVALLFSSYGPLWGHFGPFRGWRRRGCLRHHLAVESAAVPDYRGDCGVAGVLRRVKRNFSAFFKNVAKKRLYYATFLATFGQYSTIPKNKNKPSGKTKKSPISG